MGLRLPSYSETSHARAGHARAQSFWGPASSERKKHNRSKQVFLFLYLKKSFGGGGVRGAHLSWLRGEHSFQKESQAERNTWGEPRSKGKGCALSTSGQSACLGAGRGGETVCTGGQMGSAPWAPWSMGDMTTCWPPSLPLPSRPAEACALRCRAGRSLAGKLASRTLSDAKAPRAPIPWGSALLPEAGAQGSA